MKVRTIKTPWGHKKYVWHEGALLAQEDFDVTGPHWPTREELQVATTTYLLRIRHLLDLLTLKTRKTRQLR